MRLALIHALLAAALSLGLTTSAWAGFDEGWTAYVDGDYAAAHKEWLPLANEGEARAQTGIGVLYDFGQGVAEDNAEAMKWYRLAAEQGWAGAQHNLGIMYKLGNGVLQDNVQAHMWFNVAVVNGRNISQSYRNEVAKLMTPANISEAKRLAREWLAEHNS